MNENADILRGVSKQWLELGHIAAQRRKRLHLEGACTLSAGGLYFGGDLRRSFRTGQRRRRRRRAGRGVLPEHANIYTGRQWRSGTARCFDGPAQRTGDKKIEEALGVGA